MAISSSGYVDVAAAADPASDVRTMIASQSIISGAFSMTRQVIHLGWMARQLIEHTSSKGYGQIYVGVDNWLLMIITIELTIGFASRQSHLG